jgi:hypothetical protein
MDAIPGVPFCNRLMRPIGRLGLSARGLLLPLLAGMLSFHSSYAASTAEQAELSARQGVLVQQMLADISMVGMRLDPEKAKVRLQEAIARFESAHNALGGAGALGEVGELWTRVKPKLTAEPSKGLVAELFPELEKLLQLSGQVAAEAGSGAGLVNRDGFQLAARQRVLSQRMTALYMLMAWRLEGGDYADRFRQSVGEFRDNHLKLKSAAQQDPAIGEIERHFIWFDKAASSASGTYVPTIMLRSGDRLLELLDGIASRQAG